MEKQKRFNVIILGGIIIVSITIISVKCILKYNNQVARKMACFSHVSSLHACLEENFNKRVDIFNTCDENWIRINDEQYKRLSNLLRKNHYTLDMGGRRDIDANEIFKDAWGEPLIVACRKINSSELTFLVWSKGCDKIFRTDDDIIQPSDEEPPQGLEK